MIKKRINSVIFLESHIWISIVKFIDFTVGPCALRNRINTLYLKSWLKAARSATERNEILYRQALTHPGLTKEAKGEYLKAWQASEKSLKDALRGMREKGINIGQQD